MSAKSLHWETQWILSKGYPEAETRRMLANLESVYQIRLLQKEITKLAALGKDEPNGSALYMFNRIRFLREQIAERGHIEYTPMPANTSRHHFSLYQTLIRK